MRKTMHKEEGFILFEVLISIAILSLGCLFLARSISTSLRSVHEAHRYYEASLVAEEFLWKMDYSVGKLSDPELSDLSPFAEQIDWQIRKGDAGLNELIRFDILLQWGARPERMLLPAYYRKRS